MDNFDKREEAKREKALNETLQLHGEIEDLKQQLKNEQEKYEVRESAIRPILVEKVREHEKVDNK